MDSTNDNIIGFFASFNFGEPNEKLIQSYLWNETGLSNKLSHLKWYNYGQGIELILFEIHVNPYGSARKVLRKIGNYKRKEKAISIPIILDDNTFFNLSNNDQRKFFIETITERLKLVEIKVKRNKLDFDILKLISDTKKALS